MKLNIIGNNETAIWFEDGTEIFFSYNTPVAAFVPKKGYLRTKRQYSVTTSKHINNWLRDREYILVSQEEIESLVKGKG